MMRNVIIFISLFCVISSYSGNNKASGKELLSPIVHKLPFQILKGFDYLDIRSVEYLGEKDKAHRIRIKGVGTYIASETGSSVPVSVGFYEMEGRQHLIDTYFFPEMDEDTTFELEIAVPLPLGVKISDIEGVLFSCDLVSQSIYTDDDENPDSSNSSEFSDADDELIREDIFENLSFMENIPSFPGEPMELRRFIGQNMLYPQEAQENGIQGRVTVSFIVTKDGNIKDIEITKSVSPELDAEAIRVIKKMPRWNPAIYKGKPVNARMTIPFDFRLN